MDVSLDDYINTSNFKIKIGNPGFKGNKPQSGAFQPGKKRFGNVGPGNQVTDVSITVPGVPKATGKVNITNQVRDARERLTVSKPVEMIDARQKISQKPPADARQKLQNMRARKGPLDARAKIQAKKQQAPATVTSPAQQGPFTLTRTVTNNNNGVQINRGPSSNSMQITRTLTKVMPPGYEALVGGAATLGPPAPAKPPSGIKLRLGPPQKGRQGNIPSITRTVANTNAQRQPPPPAQHPLGPQYEQYPRQQVALSQSPYETLQTETRPPRIHAPVPQQLYRPPQSTQMYPPYPPQPPPPSVQAPPPGYPPPQPAPQYEGPPYPVVDPVPVAPQVVPGHREQHREPPLPRIQVQNDHREQPLPRIQVQNDQYRPPSPARPPYPQYSAPPPPPQPPQYAYPPAPQQTPPSYYPPAQPEPVIQRTVPNRAPSPSLYQRTDRREYGEERLEAHGIKRKSVGSAGAASSTSSSSGPLKLSSTNTVPVLDVGARRPAPDSRGYQKLTKEEPPIKKPREEVDENNVISPLQGYKIVITNLHITVSQDDIIELFGAVGAVKKVKLVKPGTAEVVYVNRDHAIEAAKIYHERELDGQPMVVKMATPVSAKIREAPESLPPQMKPVASGPLKLSKKPPAGMSKLSEKSDKKNVEVDVLHKALFKTGSAGTQSKPVTFTVNI